MSKISWIFLTLFFIQEQTKWESNSLSDKWKKIISPTFTYFSFGYVIMYVNQKKIAGVFMYLPEKIFFMFHTFLNRILRKKDKKQNKKHYPQVCPLVQF